MSNQGAGTRSEASISCFLRTAIATICVFIGTSANAAITCEREVVANIVAMDQPILFNRLGASNVNGMIFALERDVVDKTTDTTLSTTGSAIAGNVALRIDKRPRPLVLRVREGDCLTVNVRNLLTASANPIKPGIPGGDPMPADDRFNVPIDEQVYDRHVSFQVSGMEFVDSQHDSSSFVGKNTDSTIAQNQSGSYHLYASEEGVFLVRGMAATVGSDGNQGNSSNLLFGQVIVEPRGARIYRSQTTEEEMRLASMDIDPTSLTCGERRLTPNGQPIIDYEALYPSTNCVTTGADLGALVWAEEGKAGLPVLNMTCNAGALALGACAANEIVHSEINGLIAGPDDNGSWYGVCPDQDVFEGACPYPLESIGKRNPSLPNRLEAFRDFASMYHGEAATAQAFPGYYVDDPVFNYVLAGVRDAFMINYGSGGIGSEIIANRLGVGPMHDCLSCAYEEFFLTAFTVGDVAQLVDVSANLGLERIKPGETPDVRDIGPKATFVPYPEDPANVHHSYTGDFVKIRNTHIGNENHVFHLHNHQWLYNPNDDNSNYMDAQSIGPGSGYTYEINYGGSGNRMKSSGDAIYHCHFYPHFAQGMWYMWRNHDVFETGTPLQASATAVIGQAGFHTEKWALENGTPLLVNATTGARARALPDGEIVVGAPIPALIPLPGKAMPPLPGEVNVIPNSLLARASDNRPTLPGEVDLDPTLEGFQVPVGSLADVVQRDVNPGYPFWVAGIEDIVGQRPPTPPLDMADPDMVADLSAKINAVSIEVKNSDGTPVQMVNHLYGDLIAAQAGGFDGGLPRTALQGYAAGGTNTANVVSRLDFSKVIGEAQAVFYPEEGTDIEQVAMAYHSVRKHPSYSVDMTGLFTAIATPYVLNGNLPAIGAPYHEPCMDDQGDRWDTTDNVLEGSYAMHAFWGADENTWIDGSGLSPFTADTPRIYKGANIQFDAVLNKAGYHYPQQRILTLWEDAVPVITKTQAPEPLVMRFNTFDCGVYHHTNLVPEYYELDDYQVRTPTDIIGQHIHLPKWDLTTADGAANGWNYEDGTLSPGAVRERIHAINLYADHGGTHLAAKGAPASIVPTTDLVAKAHPYFGTQAPPGGLAEDWMGARTTMQRWFFDPVLNSDGIDRGLGIIFTHDHFGPSTHQQVGLYATVLTEPANSTWVHNQTGEQLGCRYPGEAGDPAGNCRADGGPTSWQAAIVPDPAGSALNPAGQLEPYREFYFEYSDFQHAYEAGVYVGADQNGEPLPGTGAGQAMVVQNVGDTSSEMAICDDPRNAFRCAIGPPGVAQNTPVYPDLVLEATGDSREVAGCPAYDPVTGLGGRPCPMAIDAADPGMFAVNYRNEPLALRVYDPNKQGPDGKPGSQADGEAGDLAFALQSRTDRAIPEMNVQPIAGSSINGTKFPPPINPFGVGPGDPYTPMMTTYAGDLVRVKMQAGGDEEEHNATIHGLKWLQSGSAFGSAPNSGWRNNQAAGISEQFTLTTPVIPVPGNTRYPFIDYAYSMDTSQDGWWSGMWGILRSYEQERPGELFMLPTSVVPLVLNNPEDFNGVCPVNAPDGSPTPIRSFDITAVLANDILPGNPNVMIRDVDSSGHLGNAPDQYGGTLVYNSRTTKVGGGTTIDEETGASLALAEHYGPLHDPTAMLYVYTSDLMPAPQNAFEQAICDQVGLFSGDSGDITLTMVSYRRATRFEYDYTYRVDTVNNGADATDVAATVTTTGRGSRIMDDSLDFGDVLSGATTTSIDTFTVRHNRRYPFNQGALAFEFAQLTVGDADGASNPSCPVKLRPEAGVEPLIMRAAAGDCIDVTLRNRLPATAVDLPTLGTLLGAVKRDREGLEGSTTFQTNLIKPSSHVGLHPQLVSYDVSRANGILVGRNQSGEFNSMSGVTPPETGVEHMRWYAGDLAAERTGSSYTLKATPVEFGVANLQPADLIKQGMKSLVGQLVIEPLGSTWPEALANLDDRAGTDPNANSDGTVRKTRAMADISDANGSFLFRDLSSVWTKGLTHYYADSEPVEHANGEGVAGIPEDSQGGTGMAINYGIEPAWFRLGILPNSPPGNDQTPNSFGSAVQFDLYSNSKVGGADPMTPVFLAAAGTQTRLRLGVPHSTNRGSVFALHGHVWQRDPYLAEHTVDGGIPRGWYDGGSGVGSMTIGENPLAFYQGGQESIFPTAHYDIVLPSAGGGNAVKGDYMFRDVASSNVASGLWGILRVE